MVTLLCPPLYSANLKCKLTTVDEAIDYIDMRLSNHEKNHSLVQSARQVLYRAEDHHAKSVSSHRLAMALLFVEMNRA